MYFCKTGQLRSSFQKGMPSFENISHITVILKIIIFEVSVCQKEDLVIKADHALSLFSFDILQYACNCDNLIIYFNTLQYRKLGFFVLFLFGLVLFIRYAMHMKVFT